MSDDPARWRRPTRGEWRTFAVYSTASGVYVAIGIYNVDFLLAFVTAAVYLLVAVWLIPEAIRRLR
jgi:hypothetical protein